MKLTNYCPNLPTNTMFILRSTFDSSICTNIFKPWQMTTFFVNKVVLWDLFTSFILESQMNAQVI